MEKGLARFRVSLLCFCCGCFVAAGLLRLFCCGCFVALFCCAEVADSRRRSFPLRGPLPFSGANAACGCLPPQRCRYSNHVLVQCPVGLPMPPAAVCHLSAAGTLTASWSSAQSGCQCLLRLSATSAPRELQPRPGTVPFSGANASCGCLPPQRRRYSNRVLAQCPVGLPMPPAAVCHLSAAGTPTASWSSALFGLPMPPAAVCHLSAAGTPTASWHGDHAHKYSRGILAWRRGHLSTLWHGDPQQNHFWGRVTWQDCLEPVSNRSLADA